MMTQHFGTTCRHHLPPAVLLDGSSPWPRSALTPAVPPRCLGAWRTGLIGAPRARAFCRSPRRSRPTTPPTAPSESPQGRAARREARLPRPSTCLLSARTASLPLAWVSSPSSTRLHPPPQLPSGRARALLSRDPLSSAAQGAGAILAILATALRIAFRRRAQRLRGASTAALLDEADVQARVTSSPLVRVLFALRPALLRAAPICSHTRRRRVPNASVCCGGSQVGFELGRGAFAVVYPATWRGTPVAVKARHAPPPPTVRCGCPVAFAAIAAPTDGRPTRWDDPTLLHAGVGAPAGSSRRRTREQAAVAPISGADGATDPEEQAVAAAKRDCARWRYQQWVGDGRQLRQRSGPRIPPGSRVGPDAAPPSDGCSVAPTPTAYRSREAA